MNADFEIHGLSGIQLPSFHSFVERLHKALSLHVVLEGLYLATSTLGQHEIEKLATGGLFALIVLNVYKAFSAAAGVVEV